MINRTSFNALVDDDGSNLVGTVWNKAQIQAVILDPVDGSLAELITPDTNVGTVHNWPPTLGADRTRIDWAGASQFDCTGLANGRYDQRVTVFNKGSAIARFHHRHAGSLAANHFVHPVISGPLAIAPGGWIQYAWHGSNWQCTGHHQGAWIRPPFAAAVYSTNSGAWVVDPGDQTEYAYCVQGNALHFAGYVIASSVAGTPAQLYVTLPNGYTTVAQGLVPAIFAPTGSNEMGTITTSVGGTVITISKLTSAAFGPTTNATYAYWNLTVGIN